MVLFAFSFTARISAQAPVAPPAEPAGYVPFILKIQITGKKSPKDFFVPLARRELNRRIRLKKGAGYFIYGKILTPKSIKAGGTGAMLMRLKITGPGYRMVKQAVIVIVENLITEDVTSAASLLVSNSPETINEPGILLSGTIDRRDGARYLIHHKNGTGRKLNFMFNLFNAADTPAKVLLLESGLEQSTQEMTAGHKAALQFIQNTDSNRGYIIDMPPASEYVINKNELDRKITISGMGEIHVLDGEGVAFAIKASYSNNSDGNGLREIGQFTSRRGHGFYGAPRVDIEDRFVIGGRWKFIGIGDKPLESPYDGHTELRGNYGVTYRIKVWIVNPTDNPEKAQLNFAPVSGPAVGTMKVDGELLKIGMQRPPDTFKVKEFLLKPKEERPVYIEMIPESGSFYPVRLVFMARKI